MHLTYIMVFLLFLQYFPKHSMLFDLSISDLVQRIRSRELSITELVSAYYQQIERLEPQIHACISLIDKNILLDKAKQLDRNREGRELPLFGIPFVMKDAYVTHGLRTTAGSILLNDFIPPYSATVYKRLVDAGALLLGKMSMDAWGHGATNENTDYPIPRNPWDVNRSTGGSGGGPAAAVAAGYCPFAIGEDTGGSIRNPAAWNNISALKVTYGRVSRYGAIAYASSLDTMGPTARSAYDCALVLEQIAGFDPYDATSSRREVPKYTECLGESVKGKKLALPKEYFGEGLDPENKSAIFDSIKIWESLGVSIEEISLPMLEYGVPMYYIIVSSETSSNLARYDGIRFGKNRDVFTKDTQRRIMLGTYTLSSGYYDAYYKKAQRARTLLRVAYTETLKKYDAIIAPVNPSLPPIFGELLDDPIKNMMADLYTGFINLIGVPSLAIPCGFSAGGLPIGMQLVGKMFSESTLLQLGYAYQQSTHWHTRRPKL